MKSVESQAGSPSVAPILSIAIPTYQRLKWIRQSLGIVLSQVEATGNGRVEVIVSENAGSDGTWAYLQELTLSHPDLRIHRNADNIGAESNFYQLPGMSRGRYLWLLGDDDFLADGALAHVLAGLEREPDYIALNVLLSDEDMAATSNRFWKLAADVEVHTLDEATEIIPHFAMGFISCWVARRELFNTIDKPTYDRFNKWGLSLMVDRYVSVGQSKRGLIGAEPMLTSRKPPPTEYRSDFDYFEWFVEGSAQVLAYLEERGFLNARAVARHKSLILRQTAAKRILFERAKRILDRRAVQNILSRHYRGQWAYWLLCLPALYLPGLGSGVRLVKPGLSQ